jgi:hypothetical protein
MKVFKRVIDDCITKKQLYDTISNINEHYMIDFGEWLLTNKNFFKKELTTRDLLLLFKSEKGL